jgi:hypothetical protein
MTQYPEFLQKIDWALLREQKQEILNFQMYGKLNRRLDDAIAGVINLLDSIQDYATDVMGLTDKEVFNLTPEDDEKDM